MAREVRGHRSRSVSASGRIRTPSKCLAFFLLVLSSSVGLRPLVPTTMIGRGIAHQSRHSHSRRVAPAPSRPTSDSVSETRRAASAEGDDNGGAPPPLCVGSRRHVLTGAVVAGALWRGEGAAASIPPRGAIGEPVVSGGPLPLTVGLGTGPPYAQRYVELAIDAGYRLFDTAQEYGSEEGIGNALKAAFVSGKLKRQDVFVTTKVEIDNMGYEPTIKSVRESLDSLGRLEGGIDLVLIHWPCPFVRKDEPGAIAKYSKLRRKTWEALERLQQDGVVKQIGVSNFGKRHLKELLGYAKVRPVVDQVEVHPYNQRRDLEKLVTSEGIRFEAYSPLGKGYIGLFEDPVLIAIADAKKKSVAAVVLRWLLQRGITPIPLSRNEKRLKENLDVFDFALTEEEMRAIAKLERGQFVLTDDEQLA
mmetsp:Transcript_26698/g.53228  ORF Transcript_26698/g.53228 Transcript_26698/m.53228 type:complete len:419 (-) Transcript_26698:187-1443(-)